MNTCISSSSLLLYRISFIICFMIIVPFELRAQTNNPAVEGAWKIDQDDTRHHLFLMDGYYFYTVHLGNAFQMSQGGTYSVGSNTMKGKLLFNSADSSQVGQELDIPFTITKETLVLQHPQGDISFTRVDDGQGQLAGVWRITGRMQDDGKITPIHQTGSRQTYKLLTGSKFQWVAIDPAKKQFSGTGGGSYIFKDGKYTENIEFFSRDNSRVGAALIFDGKLKDGAWHHSGLSSKGARIYEVWSKVP